MRPLVSPCPTDETLRAFGTGSAEQTVSDRVASHLDGCAECVSRVAKLSGDDFVARLRAAQPAASAVGRSVFTQPPQTIHPNRPTVPAVPPTALATLLQYTDVRELGRGGMGVVYLAQNTLMGRSEVLKVINPALLASPAVLNRFLQEIQSAAKLGHKNVVAAYAAYQTNELLVLAMEYVPGEDLDRIVTTRGPLPVPHACFYVAQAALGLQHAHDRGMVHRDIKPSNLMLAKIDGKMVVKVLDFGLAKAKSKLAEQTGLTNPGQMMGTPLYMAPEQATDSAGTDIRADIYSLGCSLYFLLTGKPPFTSGNIYALLLEHKSSPPRPVSELRPDVPPALAEVVAKMIAKDPADRFQTPGEVAKALKAFFNLPAGKPALPVSQGTTAPHILDAEVVAPAVKAGWSPPSVFRNEGLPNHTHHLNPEDFNPDRRKSSDAAPRPKKRKTRRGRSPWAARGLIAAALLAVAVGAFAVFKVQAPAGTLAIEVSEPGAELFVDGEKVTVTWADGKTAEVRVKPGTHQVELRKDGFAVAGETVTLERGGRQVVRVTLERSPDAGPARFVPLFNGKDLAGWTRPADTHGSWVVKDGKLFGRGPPMDPDKWQQAVLRTDRADYRDVRVRLVYRVLGEANGGNLFVRSKGVEQGEKPEDGKKANGIAVALGRGEPRIPPGSVVVLPPGFWTKPDLTLYQRDLGKNLVDPPVSNDVVELEVECTGTRIRTTVNGKLVRDLTDDRFAVGMIGLMLPKGANVEIHSLEIAEPAPPPAKYVPLFNGNDRAGWTDANGSARTWHVEGGKLVCQGEPTGTGKTFNHSNLLTVRNDFHDFRVRAKYRYTGRGGALVLRSKGSEPALNSDTERLSGVWVFMGGDDKTKMPAGTTTIAPPGYHRNPDPNVWNREKGKNHYDLPPTTETVELVVECVGPSVRTTVNGNLVREMTDGTFVAGAIGLVCNTAGTVTLDSIEIEELPR